MGDAKCLTDHVDSLENPLYAVCRAAVAVVELWIVLQLLYGMPGATAKYNKCNDRCKLTT